MFGMSPSKQYKPLIKMNIHKKNLVFIKKEIYPHYRIEIKYQLNVIKEKKQGKGQWRI